MYYQYDQNCNFGSKFDPEIYKRGILFIGSPGIISKIGIIFFGYQSELLKIVGHPNDIHYN